MTTTPTVGDLIAAFNDYADRSSDPLATAIARFAAAALMKVEAPSE